MGLGTDRGKTMISLIAILLTTIFYSAVGWPATYMLGKISKIERVGISFLLGNGLSTFLWFVLYRLGCQFNLITLCFSGTIIIFISILINKKFKLKYQNLTEIKPSGINLKLVYLIIGLLLASFVIGNYNPISGWDAIALYDFRGHTIALNHSLKGLTDDSYYVSYPLMISLDHAVIYMLKGLSAQGLHSIILMAFSAVIYGRMRVWTNLRLSLISVLLILLNEEIFTHSTVSYVNLSYIVYLVLGFLYIISPSKESRQLGHLFFGGLMIGLTTWIRSDVPFWIIGIILMIIQGWLIKAKLLSIFLAYVAIMLRHYWLAYYVDILNSLNQLNQRLANPITLSAVNSARAYIPDNDTLAKIFTNMSAILSYLYINIFSPYRGLWLLVIPVTIVAVKKANTRLTLLIFAILISIAMVVGGVMLFSTSYSSWEQIGGSARRMMLFIVPLSIIASINALYLTNKGKKYEAE